MGKRERNLKAGRTFLSPEPLSADSAFTPQREPTCAPHCALWGSRWPGRSSPGNKPALWRAAGQRWPGTGQTGPEDQTGTFWGRQLGEDQVSTPGGASWKSECRRQGRISEGLLRHCTALEATGRGVGARGKVTAAPPAHRVHAGLPGGPVRDTRAGPAGSLQPCVGRGDDSQGLAPSRKILQRTPF